MPYLRRPLLLDGRKSSRRRRCKLVVSRLFVYSLPFSSIPPAFASPSTSNERPTLYDDKETKKEERDLVFSQPSLPPLEKLVRRSTALCVLSRLCSRRKEGRKRKTAVVDFTRVVGLIASLLFVLAQVARCFLPRTRTFSFHLLYTPTASPAPSPPLLVSPTVFPSPPFSLISLSLSRYADHFRPSSSTQADHSSSPQPWNPSPSRTTT